MFRTNRISKDTEDIYFTLIQMFGKMLADKIMKFLVSNRTYNIQLVGASGVGKSCFGQRLLRNTFTPNYIRGAIIPGPIAFPTPIGTVVFNISECRYSIDQPNLDMLVEDEWNNTDAFFVMISHQDRLPYEQSQRWLQTIRRVRGDVPIVLVDLKCDRRGRYNLQPNIQRLCTRYGNIPYVQVSSQANTNIHAPFLALQDILRTYLDRNICADVPTIPITPLLLPPPPPHPPPPQDQEE